MKECHGVVKDLFVCDICGDEFLDRHECEMHELKHADSVVTISLALEVGNYAMWRFYEHESCRYPGGDKIRFSFVSHEYEPVEFSWTIQVEKEKVHEGKELLLAKASEWISSELTNRLNELRNCLK